MNWNDITIGKIQQILALTTKNEIKRTAQTIAILKGIPYEEVEAWSIDELRAVDLSGIQQIPKGKLKFKFKHKGRRFRLVLNANKSSAHHFMELQEVQKKDTIEALHEVIACLSYRVNIFGKRITDDYQWKVENFKDLPITDFYHYSIFFLKLYPQLLNATLIYLKAETNKVKEMYLDGSR
jgi:hypothetical protein